MNLIGGIIKKTKKNKFLLFLIDFIERTAVRFQQWLWKFVDTYPEDESRDMLARALKNAIKAYHASDKANYAKNQTS